MRIQLAPIVGALLLMFSSGLDAQTAPCGIVINDQFENNGVLPNEWTEYNSNNQVVVHENQLTFNYNASKPSAFRTFNAIKDSFGVNFTYKSSRNWHLAHINLKSSDEKLITRILLGNNGGKNFYVANSFDAQGEPVGYTEKLLNVNFAANNEYKIGLEINLNAHTLNFYIDGELMASDIPTFESSNDFAKFDIQQQGMYNGEGTIQFNYFTVSKDDINRTPLVIAIEEATEFLSSANIGSGTGEYSAEAKTILQTSIHAAQIIVNDCDANQANILAAVPILKAALEKFMDARNYPSVEATINIDPSKILCEKNPNWFGGNNTYNGNGQGLWNADEMHCEYEVINMANFTGATMYRFPGGTMANLYHWKQAIGPVNDRIDNLNSHGNGGPQHNNFGPDEFGQMLTKTPLSRGIIVVAFDWDTPQDAADYVEYMNAEVGANPNGGIDWAQVRADNGHPQPYDVKYWEIGNELYGTWELNFINYPSSGDANRGDDAIQKGDANLYVNGGYRNFTNQRAVKKTSWVDTDCQVDGTANQTFLVKFPPVAENSSFTLKINNETWTKVSDFSASTPSSKHYTLDEASGTINFGDNIRGMAPSGNHNIHVDYRSGHQPGFYEYYEAMKAVDPTIEVISCYEGEDFYRLMAAINKPFDGVTKHYYPGGTANAGDEYKLQMLNAVNLKTKTDAHISHLEKHANSSLEGKKIKQHLTEFGVDRTIASVSSLAIMWYNIINYHPNDLTSMCVHSYFKNDNTPMVNTSGKFFAAKAYAYHLFTHLHHDNFVEASHSGGSYSYKNTTIENTYPTASINKQGNIITLVIPNTLDNHKLNATINVDHYPFEGKRVKGKKWVVKAQDIYQINDAGNTDNIRMTAPIDFQISEQFQDEINPFSVAVYQWIQEEASYLSDLNETANKTIKKDESFADVREQKVNGIAFHKSISAEPETNIEYTLNKAYTHFIAEIGLDDAFTGGSAKVEVFLDDQLIYTSPTFESNSPNEKLFIDICDADKIRFEIKTGDTGNGKDYLMMGNARFVNIGANINGVNNPLEKQFGFDVFPNPFDQTIKIKLADLTTGKVELLDVSGQSIMQKNFHQSDFITLNDIPAGNSGMHLLVIRSNEKTMVSKLFRYN